jgi:hypothetical protein
VTDRKEIEKTILLSAFTVPPAVGDVFASKSGTTAFQVVKIRQMIGAVSKAEGPMLRVFGHRIATAELPEGTVTRPWPQAPKATSTAALPVMGPHVGTGQPAGQADRRA